MRLSESQSQHPWVRFILSLRHRVQSGQNPCRVKKSARNITPFVLEGLPPLHKLDQRMMRNLRNLADRTGCTVDDLIRKAILQFVAKAEAESDLENKIISFPKR
jgi:hypothetical protein